ncbi:hypothetical protein NI17_010175 [Thermobifida halotolerans]|uniref:Uncharacterized protein n=1 Tax=Thermobifida halotolerans TaxID=483545 RepID=A0A399G2C3_9ACTN|nr:hypothetical protein [Thermobifida halotolerans]UOE21438.1 hypothetical protein NI17_010175 [Thermobifida halotolerans]
MTITVPTAAAEGIRLIVAPVRTEAMIGAAELLALRQLVPSSKTEEGSRTLEYAPWFAAPPCRGRALVQRVSESVPEARNVTACASGVLGFGGGKDSCGRVADALPHPDTGYDHKSSGW